MKETGFELGCTGSQVCVQKHRAVIQRGECTMAKHATTVSQGTEERHLAWHIAGCGGQAQGGVSGYLSVFSRRHRLEPRFKGIESGC